MTSKTKEKELAISMRREGKTYSEIMTQVPVAKSTISLWLQGVGLAKKQKQRISEKRIAGQRKGAARRRAQRFAITEEIVALASQEITSLSDRELWLIGIALYWAEGSKQKEWNVAQSVQFTNSDPAMIKFYLHWLRRALKIPSNQIQLSLAIHENNKHRLDNVIKFWKEKTGNSWDLSDRVYFKRHKLKPSRHNLGEDYYGTLRVVVRRSTNLNRKIAAWAKAICGQCRVV